jgi:coenzyme F420-reducing hydrogenase delta subunit/Pyruvate/2-oxoacid:ferredoxin oxidoreductase delta subunit
MPPVGMTDTTIEQESSAPLRVTEGGVPSDPPPSEVPLPSGLLRQLEKVFLHLDRWIGRVVAAPWNPLLHTGALAVTTFLVATVSGIALLVWYKPSVHLAYASVEAMSQAPFTAGLLRSLHRYSSDAVVFFGLIHVLRVLFERRFGGARWLAWVTGAIMMALLWFIGWTGYWLVWDLRAQFVAVGTARMLDVLPIFADPLGRSLLTDEGVNSLLFFVVFFIHMLVPLAMGVVMWIHITRLARARFLTRRPMTLWVMASLLLLCAVYPAGNEAPASMTALPQSISMDWWYLFPLVVTERLSGGWLWALTLAASAIFISVPWWLATRRPAPASVVASRCNECMKCYQDCPYEAIQMVPRSDGSTKFRTQASIIPSKCVACGICAGSCDTAGIGIDWFSAIDQRRRVEAWLKQAGDAGETVHIAFTCAESAGAGLDVDSATGRCEELPGYRVMQVPCAGWVHPLLIERAMRHGAGGVLISSCGPGECVYREGDEWERQRLEGERLPSLRTDKVDEEQVRLVGFDRTRTAELIREAARLRHGKAPRRTNLYSPALRAAAVTLLAIVCAGTMGVVSDLGYAAPGMDGSQLVISLKHPGAVSENCRDLTEEEIAARPVHMRKPRECERMRASVRLLVNVDGVPVVQTSVAPSGIWKDGNSVAVERIAVEPGDHQVSVAIGETADSDEWSFRDENTLRFTNQARRVVVFDRVAGFSWH